MPVCVSAAVSRINKNCLNFRCAEQKNITKGQRQGQTKSKLVLVPKLINLVVYLLDFYGWRSDIAPIVQTMVCVWVFFVQCVNRRQQKTVLCR
jgi:hypothetical protein